jgi:hypothetical protein
VVRRKDLLRRSPDLVLTLDSRMIKEVKETLSELPAVQAGEVYTLPNITSRSPSLIKEGFIRLSDVVTDWRNRYKERM